MKVGTITEPNAKGQIVIPKKIRDALNITPGKPLNLILRGGGIYVYPFEEVLSSLETEGSYLKILQKTQGAWRGDDWEKTEKRRQRIELAASNRRKRAW